MNTNKKSVSQARLDANRANSLKSTGPRTPTGKAASSRNALTHGLTATTHGLTATDLTARGEDLLALPSLEAAYVASFRPSTQAELSLINLLASLRIRLDCCARMETGLLDPYIPTLSPSDSPSTLSPSDSPSTLSPSDSPSTLSPSDSPSTLSPSDSPSTLSPSDSPSTLSPSDSPSTLSPSDSPSTLSPSDSPSTLNTAVAQAFTSRESSFMNLSRYEATLSRAYDRTLKELLAVRKEKLDPTPDPEPIPAPLCNETKPIPVENTDPPPISHRRFDAYVPPPPSAKPTVELVWLDADGNERPNIWLDDPDTDARP